MDKIGQNFRAPPDLKNIPALWNINILYSFVHLNSYYDAMLINVLEISTYPNFSLINHVETKIRFFTYDKMKSWKIIHWYTQSCSELTYTTYFSFQTIFFEPHWIFNTYGTDPKIHIWKMESLITTSNTI